MNSKVEAVDLLSLPDHLRKTFQAAKALGRCSAQQVSELTGRARAPESGYLNKLARMGFLKKSREGHVVIFTSPSDE